MFGGAKKEETADQKNDEEDKNIEVQVIEKLEQ
jgi:hypothetical protein